MQYSVAITKHGVGMVRAQRGNCRICGEQPKHGPHQLRGHSPEESTEPGTASDLLGLGNMRGQHWPGRCWW